MDFSVALPTQQIESLCRKYHIRRLALFGSVVREDFGPQSEIDVLVDFEPGYVPGFDFFLIEAELGRLLGRRVDLQTRGFLGPEICAAVVSEAMPVYEQTRS